MVDKAIVQITKILTVERSLITRCFDFTGEAVKLAQDIAESFRQFFI
jgi:hypothetical protein